MHNTIKKFTQFYWPLTGYLILLVTVATATDYKYLYLILSACMLFVPVFDRNWSLPKINCTSKHIFTWLVLLLPIPFFIIYNPDLLAFSISTLLFAAIPEEWFFRAYIMTRLGAGIKANVLTSIVFSLLHLFTQGGVAALLVFVPSLIYGWLYQKTNDIVVVILLHALSNIEYVGFLSSHLQWLYK